MAKTFRLTRLVFLIARDFIIDIEDGWNSSYCSVGFRFKLTQIVPANFALYIHFNTLFERLSVKVGNVAFQMLFRNFQHVALYSIKMIHCREYIM